MFFFFQAEDGIRDDLVTGVQTVLFRSTRMPRIVETVKKYFKRDPCKGVHPDEVVALGAAVQANALTSEEAQVLLLDVTPQSLGVAIAGGYVRKAIPKNTTVPTSTTEGFYTSK